MGDLIGGELRRRTEARLGQHRVGAVDPRRLHDAHRDRVGVEVNSDGRTPTSLASSKRFVR